MIFNKVPALFALVGVAAAAGVKYTGVNEASMEFGVGTFGPDTPSTFPGVYDKQFTAPNTNTIPYWRDLGANIFRLSFSWERAQPTLSSALDENYVKYLDQFVSAATSTANGSQYVLLDLHNYARWNGKVVGSDIPSSALSDFWTRMANRYKSNPRVYIDIMNEPHDMPVNQKYLSFAMQWFSAAQDALNAIRNTGFSNLILVPGISYTGAHSWVSSGNAAAALSITDPLNNFAFDMHHMVTHQILCLRLASHTDVNSARSSSCTHGTEAFTAATSWLRSNNRKAFLGEWAATTDASCQASIDSAAAYLDANSDVWIGWTWWAAGPWWGDYMYSIEPSSVTSGDAAQTKILKKYFAGNSVNPGPKPQTTSTTTTTTRTTTTTTTTRPTTSATCAPSTVTVNGPGSTVTVPGQVVTVTVTPGQPTTQRTTTTTTTTRPQTTTTTSTGSGPCASMYGQW
uniref:cellulase n=1 Tax=Rhizophlyctis rosea TaxID=64517 RepID=A0A2U8U9R3_9FUNG|nr:glycoside hydrolase family 5 [Rhizophlyctis rosea]